MTQPFAEIEVDDDAPNGVWVVVNVTKSESKRYETIDAAAQALDMNPYELLDYLDRPKLQH